MARILMLVCLGLSGCPGVEKPRQREPATQETPQAQETTRKQEKTLRINDPTKTQPVEHTETPPARETPAELEIATEVIEAESDPRREAEMDAAVLPSVWVYFSRDDEHGYRAVFLFGHREEVSEVQVSYVIPSLAKFKDSGYPDMRAEERILFVPQGLRLQLSFLFTGTLHCGSATIGQANIVPAGDKIDKTSILKIALKEGSC